MTKPQEKKSPPALKKSSVSIATTAIVSKRGPETRKREIFFRCKNCFKVVLGGPDVENKYEEHKKTCLETFDHKCSICFKIFTHKRGLSNHLRTTHLVFD